LLVAVPDDQAGGTRLELQLSGGEIEPASGVQRPIPEVEITIRSARKLTAGRGESG
jgi:hypothetical protein